LLYTNVDIVLFQASSIHVFLCSPPPFKEGRAYCFDAVCRSTGRSTSSFLSLSSHLMHILKCNWITDLFKVCFGHDRAFFDRVMSHGIRKMLIICSFRSCYLLWLHILKWDFVYKFSIRKSRSSSMLDMIEFICFALVSDVEMKFSIQINRAMFYRVMPHGIRKISIISMQFPFICIEIWYTDSS
jgi:hypothetical protein